ncbi:hypothetical protein [Spirillospora sp. CA-128828]|uniref:hypothetical protein n=1 Tax=Spirillospora sp. CA-128828 TaxID=3240033 RepID=UPI003D8EEF75
MEYEVPRVFAWAVEDPEHPTAIWRFTLHPQDGRTRLNQWTQIGSARSGLSLAIDHVPEKEQKIVSVRMREFENGIIATLAAIKQRTESAERAPA